VLNVIRLKRAAGTLQSQDITDVNQWLTATAASPTVQPQPMAPSSGTQSPSAPVTQPPPPQG